MTEAVTSGSPRTPDVPAAEPTWPLAGRVFAAVLFDLDGTLVDSTPAVERSWKGWARDRGLPPPDLAANHGRPAADLVRKMVAADEFAAALAEFSAREVADIEGVVPMPGAAELFNAVPADRRAIVTSGIRPLALARIAAAGLPTPDVLITFDDVRHGKPDPEPFLLAAQHLGFAAADCLAVEDAPAGLTAATAAGCTALAIAGTHQREQLDADAVVSSFAAFWVRETEHGLRIDVD